MVTRMDSFGGNEAWILHVSPINASVLCMERTGGVGIRTLGQLKETRTRRPPRELIYCTWFLLTDLCFREHPHSLRGTRNVLRGLLRYRPLDQPQIGLLQHYSKGTIPIPHKHTTGGLGKFQRRIYCDGAMLAVFRKPSYRQRLGRLLPDRTQPAEPECAPNEGRAPSPGETLHFFYCNFYL